ncbi:hypothetical protein PCE1_001454 [Barthelona sp. PCE]
MLSYSGIQTLKADPQKFMHLFHEKRCAVLTNCGCVDNEGHGTFQILQGILGDRIKLLFTPQHGFYICEQDNMIETEDSSLFGVKTVSLYSSTRIPDPKDLEDIDVVIVDLYDVGVRTYTYIHTLVNLMTVCDDERHTIVVLDRPNVLGLCDIEGGEPVCCEGDLCELTSFVGLEGLPYRHGLTMAEVALLYREKTNFVNIEVIRFSFLTATNPKPPSFALPSPNLPDYDTLLAYPITLPIEGLGASEGRGTTKPFCIFGSPEVAADGAFCDELVDLFGRMCDVDLNKYMSVRPYAFRPTFNKGQGEICHGCFIGFRHDLPGFNLDDMLRKVPFWALSLCVIRLLLDRGVTTRPISLGYEYDFEHEAIDLIYGYEGALEFIRNGTPEEWVAHIREKVNKSLVDWMYSLSAKNVLLYPRSFTKKLRRVEGQQYVFFGNKDVFSHGVLTLKDVSSRNVMLCLHGTLSHCDTSFYPQLRDTLSVNSFCFSLQGCGRSSGEEVYGAAPLDITVTREAMRFLEANGFSVTVLFGHSKGGNLLWRVASIEPGPTHLISVSARCHMKRDNTKRFNDEQLDIIATGGQFFWQPRKTFRGMIVTGESYNEYRETCYTDLTVKAMDLNPNRSVVLIHGTDDTVVPCADVELYHDSLKPYGERVELVTVPGNHTFREDVSVMINEVDKSAVAHI